MENLFDKYETAIDESVTIKSSGIVTKIIGVLIESKGPVSQLRELCIIALPSGKKTQAEVVGFKEERVMLMPIGEVDGIVPGCQVYSTGEPLNILPGDQLIGRVINGSGHAIDGSSLNYYTQKYSVFRAPPHVVNRKRIKDKLFTGIKAIDGLLTVGKGQRLGIFSGSGVGKSTLLSMIARNTDADLTVIGLVGERGREVRDFIERDLGEEGMKKSVVVVETSDSPPLARVRATYTATAIAEYYRDQGKDVMLVIDSLTRLAYAQREISISLGEPPTTRGFSPSVFTMLPKILERSGTSENGSITAFYSVLVEGDDMDEPLSDSVRGILDGQVVLSRDLAMKNQYPPIDIPSSISRLMPEIVDEKHQEAAGKMKELIANYNEAQDLINIGAYVKGSNPVIDEAVEKIDKIKGFLKQGVFEQTSFNDLLYELYSIVYSEKEAKKLVPASEEE